MSSNNEPEEKTLNFIGVCLIGIFMITFSAIVIAVFLGVYAHIEYMLTGESEILQRMQEINIPPKK